VGLGNICSSRKWVFCTNSECLFPSVYNQHVTHMHHVILSHIQFLSLTHFSTLYHKSYVFQKRFFKQKMCSLITSTIFSVKFPIQRRIERNVLTVHFSLCQYCQYSVKHDLLYSVWKSLNNINNFNHSSGTQNVKQSHYRPGQALRVPGVWGSQILIQSSHESGKVVNHILRPPLPPSWNYCWY
jgi:hypothetical protein